MADVGQDSPKVVSASRSARVLSHVKPGKSAAALYAPFRQAVFRDISSVHIAYDQPSSVFASLWSPAINEITAGLDKKIVITVEEVCHDA